MLLLSLLVAVLQATQAKLAPAHNGLGSRLLIAALCYAQPVIRSWTRYRTRLFSYCLPLPPAIPPSSHKEHVPLIGTCEAVYWSEQGRDRTELLGRFVAYLMEHRWGTTLDSGWADWDVEVHYHPWTMLQVRTAQEDHGGSKRLILVRYRLRPTTLTKLAAVLGAAAMVVAVVCHPFAGAAAAVALTGFLAATWRRGARLAGRAADGFDGLARGLGLIRCDRDGGRR
jgi:hypothetical protein